MLEHELEIAVKLARLAGKNILNHYADGFSAEEKTGTDNFTEPVTIADREASRLIVDGLAAAFPDDAVLSEEEVDDLEHRLSKRRVWIVDPLDGTTGFINHDGDFGVQIGLAIDGIAVVGVVFLPFHDILSYAVKGEGSFTINGSGSPVRMQTSDTSNFIKMVFAASRNHFTRRMSLIVGHFGFPKIIRRGSVGLKVSLIAAKTCDIYIHPSPRTKLWDTCAPQIILEEAGGRFTDLFGFEIRYDRKDLHNRNGILATNGAAHAEAVEHLRPVLQRFDRVPYTSKK